MNENISVNEIFTKLQTVAKAHGLSLTYTNMKVYLKLLEYSEESDVGAIRGRSGVRFNVTVTKLAAYCSVSPRIVTETLRTLNSCGVIKYVKNTPDPSVITLIQRFDE